jgi:hypothetical protein
MNGRGCVNQESRLINPLSSMPLLNHESPQPHHSKEPRMQYKMIVLQLLEQHPELFNQVRERGNILPMGEYYACELKTIHEAWKAAILQSKPDREASQIANSALELALDEIQARLPGGSTLHHNQAISLDSMAEVFRSYSPRA